jgi:hypothetical protein
MFTFVGDHHIVVNDCLEEAVEKLTAIIAAGGNRDGNE